MKSRSRKKSDTRASRPTRRGTWIEMMVTGDEAVAVIISRPPRRGTWIEINPDWLGRGRSAVVPRVGGRGLKWMAHLA